MEFFLRLLLFPPLERWRIRGYPRRWPMIILLLLFEKALEARPILCRPNGRLSCPYLGKA